MERPPGTTVRVGYEVFLCSKNRPSALGKTFLFLGVFGNSVKHPWRSSVPLLDKTAFDLRKELISGGMELQPTEMNEPNIFRIAPLQFVAKVPGGKELDEWSLPIIDEAGQLSKTFFPVFEKNGRNLED